MLSVAAVTLQGHSCNRNWIDHKAYNIYHLTLYRKDLRTSDLNHQKEWGVQGLGDIHENNHPLDTEWSFLGKIVWEVFFLQGFKVEHWGGGWRYLLYVQNSDFISKIGGIKGGKTDVTWGLSKYLVVLAVRPLPFPRVFLWIMQPSLESDHVRSRVIKVYVTSFTPSRLWVLTVCFFINTLAFTHFDRHSHCSNLGLSKFKTVVRGFPGGAVVENLPANAGDTGSSPGLGRSHMPRSN